MGDPTKRYPAEFKQGVPATVLGRVTAIDGSGGATGGAGEGKWIKQADISAIACKVFDTSVSPHTSVTETITTSAILDVPMTTNVLWTQDSIGYNFEFTAPGTAFPVQADEHNYVVQIAITTTGGATLYTEWQGTATLTLS